MKKTKIIATMGPSCESKKVLTEMVKNGLNVARINFSHGNQLEYKKSIDLIKAVKRTICSTRHNGGHKRPRSESKNI